MNQLDKLRFRNETARLVKNLHKKWNVVCYNSHNTIKHEMIKARICLELSRRDVSYICEAPFEHGQADILVLDEGIVIEILVSETEKKLKEKVKKYPNELEVIAVKRWEDYFEKKGKIIWNV